MNKLILLIFAGFITLMSCDGRERVHKTNTEILQENKLLDSFAERSIFIPEQRLETITDTLLSNGFSVKIKTYSDMENTVVFTKKRHALLEKTHYRNFIFEIEVKKEGVSIYNDAYSKTRVNKELNFRSDFPENSPFYNFHNKSVLKSITVDDESLLRDKIMINLTYYIPETKHYTTSTLFIDDKGYSSFVHLEIK